MIFDLTLKFSLVLFSLTKKRNLITIYTVAEILCFGRSYVNKIVMVKNLRKKTEDIKDSWEQPKTSALLLKSAHNH